MNHLAILFTPSCNCEVALQAPYSATEVWDEKHLIVFVALLQYRFVFEPSTEPENLNLNYFAGSNCKLKAEDLEV